MKTVMKGPSRVLFVVAAPAESRAVCAAFRVEPPGPGAPGSAWRPLRLDDHNEMVVSGVGKANAAGAGARAFDPGRHDALVSIGVAGALPGSGLRIGDAVAAEWSVNADEGLLSPDNFAPCWRMGFPLGPFKEDRFPGDPGLLESAYGACSRTGGVATVSTCSGLDAGAAEVVRRTGAIAEAMEGAAVAQVAARLGVPFLELRVISNTTGDRDRQQWDLIGALARLTTVLGRWRNGPEAHVG